MDFPFFFRVGNLSYNETNYERIEVFFKKKNVEPSFVKYLRENPQEAIVADNYVAVWVTGMNVMMLIPGDYRGLNHEEINELIQDQLDLIAN